MRAQRFFVDSLSEACRDFNASHHDPQRPEPKVRPDYTMGRYIYTMELRHHLVSVIFVLQAADAMRLMQLWATFRMPKLKMTRPSRELITCISHFQPQKIGCR